MNKGSSLDVLPVQPVEVEKTKNIHEVLPQIDRNKGFLLLLLGSVNSGKSTVIANLLLNKHMYGGKESAFDGGTFVFSPSIELDDTMRFVREHCECYSEYKPEYLKMIRDRQLEYPKKKMPKICLVADDAVGFLPRSFFNFCTKYRHINSNLMISVQNFRSLLPTARSNANHVIIMNGMVNEREWEKILEEYDSIYRGTLTYMYKMFAREPYSFLYLKLRKNPPEMYKNFGEKLEWKKYKKIAQQYKSIKDLESDEEGEIQDI
tara:strand:- start:1277 stop:2065 length:789 start_codon:yes stop_codon:yes gene_type:complete